jgi:CheY-like chemotaxis protein
LDTFQRSLAHTIRFCGSTLHDTLGNLLSYARINEFERRSNQKRQKGAQESPWALLNKDEHTESGINSRGPFICTNLATLCEEIVEVTESGRTYGNSSETEDLVLVLNIDYREGWDFYTEPGAIRRILMNVVGNALKYSSRGSVRVCLKARDPPKEAKPLQEEEKGLGRQEVATKMVIFIVKDTGKGMSKDFVENHLFVPFSQENAGASEGVGLGMSIVKSLVALLGGQINVQTAVGSGTEMELTFPMKAGEPSAQDAPSTSKAMNPIVAELREKHLTVAVIRGLAPALYQALCNYLTDWFKATVVSEEELVRSDSVVDILIVRDSITSDIKTLRRMGRKHGRPALLIISATQKRCPESAINESFPVYEMVHTPLGPARLSRALLECLHKLESYSPTTEGSSPAISNESHTDVGAPELPEAVETKDDPDLAFRGKDEAMSQFKHQRAETASPPLPTSTSGKDSRSAFSDVPPLNCSQPSLLLVDDNDINLKLLQMFAKKYGARDIEAVEGGMEAVEAVKRRTGGFDMIFMGKHLIRYLFLT